VRARFGALILGVARGRHALRYVGDVGTGFTGAELDRVWARVSAAASTTCPFDTPPKTLEKAHWVKPVLSARVRYAEMTNEGRLRHPVYLSLVGAPGASGAPDASGAVPQVRSGASGASGAGAGADADAGATSDALIAQLDDLEARRKDGRLSLPDGGAVDVTNLQKIFWPDISRTKGDLLRHYVRMAPYILPVVANRPLVMKRLPNGVAGKAFYQHRAPEPVPPGVDVATLPDDDVPARLIGGSLTTLLYMAQLASISMDPWFSTMDALDHADQVAIDLDPQPGCTFERILDVARWVRDELERAGVPAFPKTSGSEGVHIFIPLPPGTPYDAGMLFCQIVATIVATRHPKEATVERTVGRRKDGTVYVDYLQNIQGKTLACAYSARASAFAGVSAPLRWDELDAGIRPQDFTIETMPSRIADVGDLWAGLRGSPGADLMSAIERCGDTYKHEDHEGHEDARKTFTLQGARSEQDP
jgi:bifunctional non-homologous end joining protein LigD